MKDTEFGSIDFGNLCLIKDTTYVSVSQLSLFVIDMSVPTVTQAFSLPVGSRFENNCVITRGDGRAVVYECRFGKQPSKTRLEQITKRSAAVSAQAVETQVETAVQSPAFSRAQYAGKSYAAMSVLKPIKQQVGQQAHHQVYNTGLRVMPFTKSPELSPLIEFFPFLNQNPAPVGELDFQNPRHLARFVAATCFQIGGVPRIQELQTDTVAPRLTAALNQQERSLLNRWSTQLATHAINLLAMCNRNDPLYMHVKQLLQQLTAKAVLTGAAFDDIQSAQHVHPKYHANQIAVLDNFDDVMYNYDSLPEDYTTQVQQRMQSLRPLLGPYPIFFAALLFRCPEMIKDVKIRENDLSLEQQKLAKLMSAGLDIPELGISQENLDIFANGGDQMPFCLALESQIREAKLVSKELFESLSYVFLRPSGKLRYLVSAVLFPADYISFVSRFSLENDLKVCMSSKLKSFKVDREFSQSLTDFVNNSISKVNKSHVMLAMLEKTGQLFLLQQIFAQQGFLEKAVEIMKNTGFSTQVYHDLLLSCNAAGVLEFVRQKGLITPDNVQHIARNSAGIIRPEVLLKLLKEMGKTDLETLRLIGRTVVK